jgi:hypothetical protein
MLDWTLTNHVWSTEHPVLASQLATVAEGMALVNTVSSAALPTGSPVVRPSAGSTTQPLIGIAMMPRRATTNFIAVSVTAPVGAGTILLPNTVTGTIGAMNPIGAMVAVSSGAASSTNIQSGTDATTGLTNLTFDATDCGYQGGTFTIFYNYTMTTQETLARFGTYTPGPYPSDMIGSIGVLRIGRVATNCVAADANWIAAADGKVKVIANGLFTSSDGGVSTAAGIVPANVDVISFPTTSYPWLVMEIH